MPELDLHEDPDDPGRVSLNRDALAALQQTAAKDADRDARTEQLARENIALRVGVDLDNPNTAFLLNGWPDGADFTAEAVRSAAEGLGLLKGQTPDLPVTDAPVITPEEQRQTDIRQQLQPGSAPAGGEKEVHPSLDAVREVHRVLRLGGDSIDAVAAGVNRIVQRAAAGTAPQLIIRGNAGEGEPVNDILERKGHLSVIDILPTPPTPVAGALTAV